MKYKNYKYFLQIDFIDETFTQFFKQKESRKKMIRSPSIAICI